MISIQFLLLLACGCSCWSTTTAFTFLHQPPKKARQQPPIRLPSLLAIGGGPGDTDSSHLPANFNPLDYKTSRSDSATLYSGTRISLRKTKMEQLVNELLNTNGSPEQLEPILTEYQEFLLEPLDDDEAVLDPDSIYTASMTREDRYQAYRTSMTERVQQARNPQVKTVLQAMQEFVLRFE